MKSPKLFLRIWRNWQTRSSWQTPLWAIRPSANCLRRFVAAPLPTKSLQANLLWEPLFIYSKSCACRLIALSFFKLNTFYLRIWRNWQTRSSWQTPLWAIRLSANCHRCFVSAPLPTKSLQANLLREPLVYLF